MTKQEAEEAMSQGKKVTHIYFYPGEYITKKNGMYVDENGYIISPYYFWKHRTSEGWQTDWEIFEEPPKL